MKTNMILAATKNIHVCTYAIFTWNIVSDKPPKVDIFLQIISLLGVEYFQNRFTFISPISKLNPH